MDDLSWDDCPWMDLRENIQTVVVEPGVTTIAQYAFYNCPILTKVWIPEGVTSIGGDAFSWCVKLESLTIPETVSEIGLYAFYSCDALKTVTIPKNVSYIGNCAFSCCDKLEEFLVAEENAGFLSDGGVLFSRDLKTLVQYPVGRADASYTVPDGVKELQSGCFYGARKLENVTLPDSLKTMGYSVFDSCGSLKSITIPDGVKKIAEYAFEYDLALESITLPASLTSIGWSAFDGCDSLSSIYFGGSAAQWERVTIDPSWNDPLFAATVYYGSEVDVPTEDGLDGDFEMKDVEGVDYHLSDYYGTPIVVNFWATWCGPCLSELGHFDEACAEYEGRVQFLMVDMLSWESDSEEDIYDFARNELGYRFPIFFDYDESAAEAYEIQAIPVTLFIKADGTLNRIQVGSMDRSTLYSYIAEILP